MLIQRINLVPATATFRKPYSFSGAAKKNGPPNALCHSCEYFSCSKIQRLQPLQTKRNKREGRKTRKETFKFTMIPASASVRSNTNTGAQEKENIITFTHSHTDEARVKNFKGNLFFSIARGRFYLYSAALFFFLLISISVDDIR